MTHNSYRGAPLQKDGRRRITLDIRDEEDRIITQIREASNGFQLTHSECIRYALRRCAQLLQNT